MPFSGLQGHLHIHVAYPQTRRLTNTLIILKNENTSAFTTVNNSYIVLQLPKHKSVVVTLNDSDDSESDGESSKATNSVFGGLESMIKEARRTAEVCAVINAESS